MKAVKDLVTKAFSVSTITFPFILKLLIFCFLWVLMYDSHSQEKNDMLSMVHAYNVLYLIQFT